MKILHNILEADVHLIKLNGPLTASMAEEVKRAFRDAYDKGARRLIVNLEDVPLIDSRGLTTLVAGLKILRGDARNFRLVAPQVQPKLLFELTGFDRIFQIFETMAKAVTV